MSKVKFDVNNKEHVKLFKDYMVSNRWGTGCPFELEYPWLSIPDMIKDQIARHFLKIEE